jgi:hypothetical protein
MMLFENHTVKLQTQTDPKYEFVKRLTMFLKSHFLKLQTQTDHKYVQRF